MAFTENKIDVLKKIKASKSFEDLEKLRLFFLKEKNNGIPFVILNSRMLHKTF